ncbi:hypothetical protein R1flu_010351 [Riccia fluitans]|uniref:Uncharacterized protein n=1 Tax=Riccia fluitans TaxID=41844 RepID=A0ABD1Z4R5_9MARC
MGNCIGRYPAQDRRGRTRTNMECQNVPGAEVEWPWIEGTDEASSRSHRKTNRRQPLVPQAGTVQTETVKGGTKKGNSDEGCKRLMGQEQTQSQ